MWVILFPTGGFSQAQPILFVTQVPWPDDFATMNAVFGNHRADIDSAPRGGALWIRYPNGALKNLTAAAGYGRSGLQTPNGIAVRDPAVHWDGAKAIFSMVVGAPNRYESSTAVFQLFEITGLGVNDTPAITRVPGQPSGFNNVMPEYGSDERIVFVSDRPRAGKERTYPQRDEYESTPTNTGIWRLDPRSGELEHLDHAPSGDFDPIIDSFGRVIFSRWDHLQRDQQNLLQEYGAFNFASEDSALTTTSAREFFPEPRSSDDPDARPEINLHTMNLFFPWMMTQRGEGLETLNHIGRHEIGGYIERSFNDDPSLEEYYGQYPRLNQTEAEIFLQIREDPTVPGRYYGIKAPEFGTHAAGQIVSLTGPPGMNPEAMPLIYHTHPTTSSANESPVPGHSGLYRDPLPLTGGELIAAHTATTRTDANEGTRGHPRSRYDFRLKRLVAAGGYLVPGETLTPGIVATVSFYDPDELVTFSGVTLWELQPVEVVARPRPPMLDPPLPAIEREVLARSGVQLDELREFLVRNELALVVGRNVTVRDGADRQQPRNLRSGTVETRGDGGMTYDLAQLQFFQGDLVRGYRWFGNDEPGPGRRVLAQPMHGVTANPPSDGPPGSVAIAADGSIAAFVPAGRALTWQATDGAGRPVVRERVWVTFKKGEIRVCSSCHQVNTRDQAGRGEPQNPPAALAALLGHWQRSGGLTPRPVPPKGYGAAVRTSTGRTTTKIYPGKAFDVWINAPRGGERLAVTVRDTKGRCSKKITTIVTDEDGEGRVRIRLPRSAAKATVRFRVKFGDQVVAQTALVRVVATRDEGPSTGACFGMRGARIQR